MAGENEVQMMSYPRCLPISDTAAQCASVLAAREELKIENKATGVNLSDLTN